MRLEGISGTPLDDKRERTYIRGVDIYDQAVKRLKADSRSLLELERESGIPYETLRDIKSGRVKSSRMVTIRRVAKFYFPKQMSA